MSAYIDPPPQAAAHASNEQGGPLVADSAQAVSRSFAQGEAEQVDLRTYRLEDWIGLAVFWAMTVLVFLQFFTRYVLNDSFAWTEELAVYGLIAVVFIGSAVCVRRRSHIQVNLLYRYLPHRAARACATGVDVAVVAFFAYGTWVVARYATAMNGEIMTTLMWQKSHVYWIVCVSFAWMTVRALQVLAAHWRQQSSALERPQDYQ